MDKKTREDTAINCNRSDHTVSFDDQGTTYFQIDVIGLTISFLALTVVGFAILSDKRVKAHPNKIIAYICLSDAYNYFQILSRYIVCGFGLSYRLDYFFSQTVLKPYYYVVFKWLGVDTINNKTYDQIMNMDDKGILMGSATVRLGSWYFISIMVSYMSLFFSTTIILDLYYVLKNPFSSTENRIKKMTFLTIIFSIIFSALGLRLTLTKLETISSLNMILFLFISITNILLGIVTMAFVVIHFRTKGMSKNIKK